MIFSASARRASRIRRRLETEQHRIFDNHPGPPARLEIYGSAWDRFAGEDADYTALVATCADFLLVHPRRDSFGSDGRPECWPDGRSAGRWAARLADVLFRTGVLLLAGKARDWRHRCSLRPRRRRRRDDRGRAAPARHGRSTVQTSTF
mmetsp:Transcript_12518/g.37215  ORF Transcript_12518/g.37215 Transcript_12518/m.37215 type:complete len:149 (-) Transcript_12518:164-610(-)